MYVNGYAQMNGRTAKTQTLWGCYEMYGHIPVVARVVNKHTILDEGAGSSSVHVDSIDNTMMNQQLGKLMQIGSGGRGDCLAKNRSPSV